MLLGGAGGWSHNGDDGSAAQSGGVERRTSVQSERVRLARRCLSVCHLRATSALQAIARSRKHTGHASACHVPGAFC